MQHGHRRLPHCPDYLGRSVGRHEPRGRPRPGPQGRAADPYIGVDEKAFRKGHRYHTIVCDLARSTVEFVAEDRRAESLAAYYAQLTDEQRDARWRAAIWSRSLRRVVDAFLAAVARRQVRGQAPTSDADRTRKNDVLREVL
jgi:hypothetical protein